MLTTRGPQHDPLIVMRLQYYARLRRLVSYIKDHISDPLDLEQAARIACMERTAFSRFFSKSVGITYHDFIQQWRISIAVDEMLRSDASITDLAFAVGFQSVNTFERAFKKITNLTPSEYKKQLLLQHQIIRSQKLMRNAQDFVAEGQ